MAANEDRTALWRTPLSTPLRSNENGFQDLFKHSEKLLASAVSICRLKGSVECQTGGIITVCEEMQRLLRLAFNETGRLENELKKQRHTYDEEISLLKERIAYLEETSSAPKTMKDSPTKKPNERLPLKPFTYSENTLIDDNKEKIISKVHTRKTNAIKSPEIHLTSDNTTIKPKELENQNEVFDKVTEQYHLMEEQDKIDEDESDDLSLEISVFDIPKETKPNTNSKKITDTKKQDETISPKGRKSKAKKTILSAKSAQKEVLNKESNAKKGNREISSEGTTKDNKREKTSKDSTKEINAKKRSSTKQDKQKIDNNDVDSANFDANDSSSSDVFLNPESGLLEIKECSEPFETPEQDTKPKKRESKSKNNSTSNEKDSKPKRNTKKETAKQKKESPKTSNADIVLVSRLPESTKTHCSSSPIKTLPESLVTTMPKQVNAAKVEQIPKSSPQPSTNDSDDVLGDMSFLIDISSMISSFVGGSESQQLELPLMLARERADARKLAGLFNLHISIGNKADSRSSLILSKTPNSQMPRPGKLDNLLSKLSIAAAREAERLSSKARTMKRKVADEDDSACIDEMDSQTKRGGKARNKKAKI